MGTELDSAEQYVGRRCEEMTGFQLASYVRAGMQDMGYDLPLDDLIDRKIMDAFQRRYGKDRAGKIVRWVMTRHQGRKDGTLITCAVFSAKMKWWTDQMYLDYQQNHSLHEDNGADADSIFDATRLI